MQTDNSVSVPAVSRLAQRLHDAGRIAGRLAHDFDNILMGVTGFAELAQGVTLDDAPAREYQASLLKVARLGQSVTRRLHEFNRCGQVIDRPTDPAVAWRAVWLEMSPSIESVNLLERGLSDLPRVAMGPTPWTRVLTELTRNAVEAMPDGGNLTVEADVIVAIGEFETFGLDALSPGRYVRWSISDTGTGISDGMKQKLESDLIAPTKTRRRGMGLPIALRTLIVHGGGLRLDAASPHGVAAVIYLPVAIETAES